MKNEEDFNKLIEEHCKAKSNKPKKIEAFKNKVLAQVKIIERRNRSASLSSTGSDKRNRSSDSNGDGDLDSKSFRLATAAQ